MADADAEPRPEQAHTVAQFVELLHQLRQLSGCTYRELERRAAEHGDVLPRSTIADVLRRSALPRAELLAAFVRACGAGDQVERWLQARDRLTEAAASTSTDPAGCTIRPLLPATDSDPVRAEDPPRRPEDMPAATSTRALPRHLPEVRRTARPLRNRVLSARKVFPLALGALLLASGWALLQSANTAGGDPRVALDETADATPGRESTATGSASSILATTGGWVRIRPAGSPALCVTEGREHTGRYTSAIAVQRSCAEAEPPRTYLRLVRGDLFHIEWHHPQFGKGCLTVLGSGPAQNMLEPWEDCSAQRQSQLFHIEPTNFPQPGGYRIRPAHTRLCLGLRNHGQARDSEVIQETCTRQDNQEFLIDVL